MSSRILDTTFASTIAELVTEAVAAEGYTSEEIIPGLVVAVIHLATLAAVPDQALDEAVDLLTRGVEVEESTPSEQDEIAEILKEGA